MSDWEPRKVHGSFAEDNSSRWSRTKYLRVFFTSFAFVFGFQRSLNSIQASTVAE